MRSDLKSSTDPARITVNAAPGIGVAVVFGPPGVIVPFPRTCG
ncbi:MAG TPA: hypothetical protein VD995_22365 [Azospirillum sp.]|nr:hypothetical protein [Azospirillum sp.]